MESHVTRVRLLETALLPLSVILAASDAHAQASAKGYPNRVIRVIVPAAAGGGTDIIARTLAPPLTR